MSQVMDLMNVREEMAPWMHCQEILVKAKNELILEAIDALHREADAKRIEIQGSTMKIEGKNNDIDRDMFVINNLLAQEEEIRRRYNEPISRVEHGLEKDPVVVERTNELGKFLLSLTEIHMTMKYARVFDQWVLDIGNTSKLDDPAGIIAETAKRNVERIDALDFIIGDRSFMKNEGLSESEFEVVKRAFFMCKGKL